MRRRRAILRTVIILALITTASWLVACSGGPPTGPVPPGTKTGVLGGMEVVGYLEGPDTQRSAWTVFEVTPGPFMTEQPRILATLRPGSVDQAGIAALEGRYIWAAGRGSSGEGADAVPEIRVDGIDVAQEP